jgi:transcription antitermination factor NusA-like protein
MNNEFKVGDFVKLYCPTLLQNTRSDNTIQGVIVEIFDVLFPDGTEGNLEIDIKSSSNWIRYKPQKDGGSLTLMKRVEK